MIDWTLVQNEYDALVGRLADSNLDHKTRVPLQKRSSQLNNLLTLYKKITQFDATIADCEQQMAKESSDMQQLYQDEIKECQDAKVLLEQELDGMLFPEDEHDSKSVFLEIRAGTGGQEAALFAANLFKMYSMYASKKGWAVSVVEEATTDLGGFKELIIHIQGKDVYKFLKHESGVHRVQRVPKTETAGRVHTSTVTVAVLPELEDVEITIDPKDLRIDTYRAGGAGGQHVNKTDSAVRFTHIPSGLVVACQDERSQLKNRQKALKILQARLIEQERLKKEAQMSATRKQQMGTGERAEKIRTYNFPQNRVTDHRTDVTLKKLDMVMEGDMDDLIEPLIAWDRQQRREHSALLGE